MVRTVGLWRAVVHRSRADWPVVGAAFVLLVCAITLLATGALYGDTVALGGLRRAILAAPPAGRAIVVRMSASATDVEPLDRIVADRLAESLAAVGGDVGLVVRSGSLAPVGLGTEAARQNLTVLAAYDGLERHASLETGHWATAGKRPVEATLSDGAAAALGLAIGDRIELTRGLSSSQVVEIEVVGVYRPTALDPYWLADPLEVDGVRQESGLTTRGPFAVSRDDLLAEVGGTDLALEWRALPAIDGLRTDRVDALRTDVQGVGPALRAAVPPPRQVSVQTNLPAILSDASRSILVSRSGITLLTIQFAVLAGYAILLVAGLLIERRRGEVALLRSRGATAGHLVALAFGEAVLLALPAAALAALLAVGLVRIIGMVGPLAEGGVVGTVELSPATAEAAAIAALGCVLVLTLPSLASGGTPASIRAALGRQVGRTLAQRLGIDLMLVVLAGIALWQLRLYGAPLTRNARGVLGVDPLLVAAPAIGLLAGAVLATRLIPRLAEVGERVLGRRRGIVPPLGARQVARRPLRYTRAALLLVLAAALGTFAASSAATWARSQADQAGYQAAADARLVLSDYPDLPVWGLGSAYRPIPGVTEAMPVSRQSLDVGRTIRDGQLLALDPRAAGRIVAFPPDAAGAPRLLGQLVDDRPATSAVTLAGQPSRLGLVLDADLRGTDGAGGPAAIPADSQVISVALVVRDGDGRLQRIEGGTIGPQASKERVEIPLTKIVDGVRVQPAYPLSLEAIELSLEPPPDLVVTGSVDLAGVESSDAEAGGAWAPVAFDPGASGWGWTRTDVQGASVYRPPAGAPGRIEAGLGDETSGALYGSADGSGAIFRLIATPTGDGALAAIAGDRLLAITGANVGDTIAVTSAAQSLTVRIVARVPVFPPLDPGTPFLVVDGASLDLAAYVGTNFPAGVREWWLSIEDGRTDGLASTVGTKPYSVVQVIRRAELARSLANDPIWLGVVGVLGLGSLAAIAFAAIGFLVSATVSTQERIGELALLRAVGLSGRQLSAWLTLEHVFLLVVGLVGGCLLGLVLAWLVLPYATLSASGAPAIPAPVIVVPWETIVPVSAIVGLAVLVVAAGLARQLPEARVSRILRSGEG